MNIIEKEVIIGGVVSILAAAALFTLLIYTDNENKKLIKPCTEYTNAMKA